MSTRRPDSLRIWMERASGGSEEDGPRRRRRVRVVLRRRIIAWLGCCNGRRCLSCVLGPFVLGSWKLGLVIVLRFGFEKMMRERGWSFFGHACVRVRQFQYHIPLG